jgi:hypothetical protein
VLEFALPFSCPFFLHFIPFCNIFLHLCLYFAIGNIHQETQAVKFNCICTSGFTDCSCLLLTSNFNFYLYFRTCQASIVFSQLSSSIVSCTSGLLRLQLSSSIFQVQLLSVLPDYSGYNCFLRFFNFNFNGFFRSFI